MRPPRHPDVMFASSRSGQDAEVHVGASGHAYRRLDRAMPIAHRSKDISYDLDGSAEPVAERAFV
jgi:hypothetical protein